MAKAVLVEPGRVDSAVVNSGLGITGALDHDGATAGFFGAAPVARQTAPAALTDNTAGTKDNTVEALPATQATPAGMTAAERTAIHNNFAELAEEVNQLRTILVNLGLAS